MSQMKMLSGVVEVGLFCHMAKAAYFGNEVSLLGVLTQAQVQADDYPQDGSVTIRWNDGVVQQISAENAS